VIARLLKALIGALERYAREDEHRDAQDSAAKRTANATVVMAVTTIAIAVLGSCQYRVLYRQLDEMTKQRLVTMEQVRADIRQEKPVAAGIRVDGTPILGGQNDSAVKFGFSPEWTNAGSTPAKHFRSWFDVRAFDIGPKVPIVMDARRCPKISYRPVAALIVPAGGGKTEPAKMIPRADVLAASGNSPTKYILMWGHMEYRDVFPDTPLRTLDYCFFVAPNDPSNDVFSFMSLFEKTEP
jgi:hypothetical protein